MVLREVLKFWPSFVLSIIFCIFLAICSSAIAVCLGPILEVFSSDDPTKVIAFSDIFNSLVSEKISKFFKVQSVSYKQILNYLPFFLFILALIQFVSRFFQKFFLERISEKIALNYRKKLFDQSLKVEPRHFILDKNFTRSFTEVSSILNQDINMIRSYIVNFYCGVPRELFRIVFYLILMLSISSKLLFIFVFAVLPCASLLITVGRKVKKYAQKVLSNFASLVDWLELRLEGIETIKHYKSEVYESNKFAHEHKSLTQKFLKAAKYKALSSPVVELSAAIALAAALYFAFNEMSNGAHSAKIISFFGLAVFLGQSASKLAKYWNSNRLGSAAINRFNSQIILLQKHSNKNKTTYFQPLEKNDDQAIIKAQSIEFSYDAKDSSDFRLNFSGEFVRGKQYALVGPSGSGKTTLMHILMGLIPSDSGKLLYDESLKACYVPQKPFIYSDSVARNISLPNDEIDESRVVASLNKVGLSGLISELEYGIKTKIGGSGRQLSGGQMQRIVLARVLYHDCSVVFLDEATSALDLKNEKLFFNALDELKKNNVCIIHTAHRTSVIDQVDHVFDLSSHS